MHQIFKTQREFMKEFGFDGMVTLSPENTAYMIGTPVPSQPNIRSRHVATICTMKHDPIVICVNIEEELVKKQSWIEPNRVYSYNEFTTDPIVLLAEKLIELGLDGCKVGIEFNYLPAKDYLTLIKFAPHIQFVDGAGLLDEMRKIKFQYELDFIERFGKGAEDVIFSAFEGVSAGDTELDIYRILMNGWSQMGGDRPGLLIATGERSSMLNAGPTSRVLRKGDMVRIDLVGTKNGYYCDVCRTAVVGEPTHQQAEIWDVVVKTHDNIISQLKPGVDTHEIFLDYEKRFRATGYEPSTLFVGHGLGISAHEEPYINPYSHNILRPGMAMCVEPIYIVPGQMGFQLENEIFITEDGCKVISSRRPYDKLPQIRC